MTNNIMSYSVQDMIGLTT